ncbi:MAG: M28 family peptidase [Acidobacteriota bacterium]
MLPLRVLTRFAALSIAAAVFVAPAVAQELTCAVVDIHQVGPVKLAQLQALPHTDWWVEADDELLLCGGEGLTAEASATGRLLQIHRRVQADQLYRLRRAHDKDFGLPGVRALVRGGRFAVIEMGDGVDRKTPWHALHSASEGSPGPTSVGAALEPFAPNMVLVRQAANMHRPARRAVDPAVQVVVDEVDGQRWQNTNNVLSGFHRHTHAPAIDQARDWLAAQFGALPGLIVTTPTFEVDSTAVENVIATLPGSERPDEWWIVGAHYDARSASISDTVTPAPGAEDNGSGCSGVLEMARIFTKHRPEETVIFMCYAGEEQGLFGSAAHAEGIVQAGDASKVQGMFNMDMISYSPDSDFDVLLGSRTASGNLPADFMDAADDYANLRVVTSTFTCCSDHVPYLNRNLPAIAIYSNDWSQYPDYHETTDVAANNNSDQAAEVIKAYTALLATKTNARQAAIFADGFESGDLNAWSAAVQ